MAHRTVFSQFSHYVSVSICLPKLDARNGYGSQKAWGVAMLRVFHSRCCPCCNFSKEKNWERPSMNVVGDSHILIQTTFTNVVCGSAESSLISTQLPISPSHDVDSVRRQQYLLKGGPHHRSCNVFRFFLNPFFLGPSSNRLPFRRTYSKARGYS